MTNGPHGKVGHCSLAISATKTHLVGFDELDSFLDPAHGHENEHNRDVRHGVVQHSRRMADFDALGITSLDIDVV